MNNRRIVFSSIIILLIIIGINLLDSLSLGEIRSDDEDLADNDIDIQQTKDYYKHNIDKEYAKISRNSLIKDIVNKITHDTWGRYYDKVTTEDPSLLLDDRVVKAIEDSEKEGGAIARQLSRRLDAIRSSMPKDLYDM